MVENEKKYRTREAAKEGVQILLAEYKRAQLHEGRETLLREMKRVEKLIQVKTKRWLVLHIKTCMDQLATARINFDYGHWEASARIHKAMRIDLTDDPKIAKAFVKAMDRRQKKYEKQLVEAEALSYELDEGYDSFGSLRNKANVEVYTQSLG